MSKTNFQDGNVFDFYKPHAHKEHYDFGPSLTRQEFAEECDINVIMKRFENTGQLPANTREPVYMDLTDMPTDLMSSLEMLRAAEKAFMTLPAVVRKEFDNSPEMFVAFASDRGNLEQLREWGLAPAAEVLDAPKEPVPAAPVPAPAAPATPG
ncbi:MAG: internal scaffolding protein [Microviridae sp.]|nr:MAG: internal scaffolding protein [Microviridae sp.]